MSSTPTVGILKQPDGRFNVDRNFSGERIRKKGFVTFDDAEGFLIEEMMRIRIAKETGEKHKTYFAVAAEQYKAKFKNKPSLKSDIYYLNAVMPFIGNLTLEEICDDTLEPFIESRKAGRWSGQSQRSKGKWIAKGVKNSTINHSIDLVAQILELCARNWRNDSGQYWLDKPPMLTRLPLTDVRPPRPLEWSEQEKLIAALPEHLKPMALFALNTAVRDDVVVNLQWDWLEYVPELDMHVFIVPPQHVKARLVHKSERILVLNSKAWQIVKEQKGKHDEFVFTYAGRNITEMNNSGWHTARTKIGIPDLHVHDLRHTAATRLNAAKVDSKTISAILWHKAGSITDHYTPEMLRAMKDALELISDKDQHANVCMHTILNRFKARKQGQSALRSMLHLPTTDEGEPA